MVPVLGKKSVIGTLALGSRHRLHYSPDEMEFLTTTAHQLGWRLKTCAWWNRFCARIGSGPTPSIPSMTWSCCTTPNSA